MLLSGGLDSAVTLAIANSAGYETHALTLAYGQRHHIELEAACRVASAIKAASHRTLAVPLDAFGGSALTDDIEVPLDRDESAMAGEIPSTYVPARNTVFLSLALAYAETLSANDIFLGVNAIDYSGYPDCRPAFLQAFEALANVATRLGVEGAHFHVHAPLIQMTKVDILRRGLELGVDFSLTHSCYAPDGLGRACGRCDSCQIRRRAFAELGREDPALV